MRRMVPSLTWVSSLGIGKMNKGDVRRNVLKIRDAISVADKAQYDASIRETITSMTEYRDAEVILAYASYRSEVDTLMLIKQALNDGKYVFAPKVVGNEMEFWKITTIKDLQEGYRGILEPVQNVSFPDWVRERCSFVNVDKVTDKDKAENCASEVCKVMMWMPGVVFDGERHRIGYGGGFYDRYLNRLLQQSEQTAFADQARTQSGRFILTTVALAYSCQILEQIPYDEHDVKPNMLVTEQEICS